MRKQNIAKTSLLFVLLIILLLPLEAEQLYQIPTVILQTGKEKGVDLSVYKVTQEQEVSILPQAGFEVSYHHDTDSLFLRATDEAPRLNLLPVLSGSDTFHLLIRLEPMVRHTFTFSPQHSNDYVVVMGGFNDWSRSALPLSDSDGDGVLERTVYLKPERHEYKFVVNGEELIDPDNSVFISNNIGGWNSILDLSHYREAPAGRFIKDRAGPSRLHYHFIPPEDEAEPANIVVLLDNQVVPEKLIRWRKSGQLSVKVRDMDGLLRITGLDEKGRVIPENHTILHNGKPLHPDDQPEDWHFSILYSLMVDRFLDSDSANTQASGDPQIHPLADFHGGDLSGIIDKLKSGYFTDLGVNALWLSPVGKLPEKGYVEWIPPNRKFTGYHGYWPVDPREVDSRFGTKQELKELVNIAHEQGIRVLLDFVSNHVHEDHPYFRNHPDWFGSMYLPGGEVNIRNWSEETRLTTWFDSFLPSYDFVHSPEAIDQVVDDALWWLETFKLDGFRQDAVKHVPHSFWRQLTARMRQDFPDRNFYQIGETFGSDELILSYVNPGELDAQFNFAIYFNARGVFRADEADFSHLSQVLLDNAAVYGQVNLMGNITSSHDQVRFMAFADGQLRFDENGTERAFSDPPEKTRYPESYRKLANFTAFNLALPGIPVIYYGDEVGLMGAGDPDNRRPMRFAPDLSGDEQWLLQETSRLCALRQKYPSLSVGDLVPLATEGPVMVFAKIYFDETILVAFNQSDAVREVEVKLPIQIKHMNDLLTGEGLRVRQGNLILQIPPYSHQFLLAE
ncbi:MAG: alpha-amylase family glycosyl hydrolase [Fidelibacterota bacterium]